MEESKEEQQTRERKLVRRMKSGDREAFDELYDIYCRPLLRTVYLLLGSSGDAEDVVQDTFVKAYLHSSELKAEEGFRSWLYQIATRTAWEYTRKRKREILDDEVESKAEKQIFTDGETDSPVSRQRGPLEQIIHREENQVLWQAVEQLEEKQRTTVILYYYNEFSTGEIARIMGTFEGTVKSRLFTARKNLKKQLQNTDKEIKGKGGLEYGRI